MRIKFRDTRIERVDDDLVLKSIGYYEDKVILRLNKDEMESMWDCKLSEYWDVEGMLESFDEEIEKLVREHARRIW